MADLIYYGVVQGNVVVLPEGVQLTNGLRVEVHAPSPAPAGAELATEEEFKERLHARGLLLEIKRPPYPPVEGDRSLVQVEGKPLSEIIIEERR